MLIVLHGPDSFRATERLLTLRQAFIDKYDPGQLNVLNLDLTEVDLGTVHQHLSSQGLFATKRFLCLRGLEIVKTKAASQLVQELTQLAEDTIVVCRIKALKDLVPELQAVIKASARVEDFSDMDQATLERWLRQRLASAHVTITTPAFRTLVEGVGHDVWLAAGLITQLAHVGTSVTPEILQRYLTSPLDDNIFHFTDAIAKKQRAVALRLLHDQLQAGAQPTYLIALLARQLMLLLQVKENPQGVAGHPYAIQKAQQHAQHFECDQLQRLHTGLTELDWQFKHNSLDSVVWLERWVVQAST